jgi:hypothetical protein
MYFNVLVVNLWYISMYFNVFESIYMYLNVFIVYMNVFDCIFSLLEGI